MPRIFSITTLLALLVLAAAQPCAAVDYYVDYVNGVNSMDRDGLSWLTAWKTVTFAFGRTQANVTADTYHIAPATYDNDPTKPAIDREIFPLDLRNGMRIIGSGADTTIIDAGPGTASARAACSVFEGAATQNFLFQDLTIHGMRTTLSGGGLSITGNAVGSLLRVHLEDNDASGSGGGFYASTLNGNITDCTFTDNSASAGGGFLAYTLTGNITDCEFTGNSAYYYYGGGFYVGGSLNGDVTDCEFIGNSGSSQGGGCYINVLPSARRVARCLFLDNSAASGSALYVSIWSSAGQIENCVFARGSEDKYQVRVNGTVALYNNLSLIHI